METLKTGRESAGIPRNAGKLTDLDIYKALGAFLVIFIHITAAPAVMLKPAASLFAVIGINRFALPAVPAFIFASGMALVYSFRERELHYGAFLQRRFTKILIPYLVWCGIYYFYNVKVGALPLSAGAYASGAVTGRLMYHLYFVVIILQFYLLFGLFLALVRRVPGTVALPAVFLISLAAVKWTPMMFPGNSDRIFLTYLMYFVLGCYFGKNPELAGKLVKRWALPLIGAFLAFGLIYCRRFYLEQALGDYSGSQWDNVIYLFFCTSGVLVYYLAAMGIGTLNREATGWFGTSVLKWILLFAAASYYIYLSHPLAIIVADKVADRLLLAGTLDRMALEFLVICVTAVPCAILYAKGKEVWKRRRKMRENGRKKLEK